jgi:hypothetical protein
MSYAEALEWGGYIERTGPIDIGQRLDRGFAMLAVLISQLGGKRNAKMEDFLPQRQEDDATLDDVLDMLHASKNSRRK